MRHRIQHTTDPALVRRAARAAATAYGERFPNYAPKVQWLGDDQVRVGVQVHGVRLDGTLSLEPGVLVFDVTLPLLLRPLSGRAIPVVEREVRRWLQRAEQGEL